MPRRDTDADLLAGVGPHLVSDEEYAWAEALVGQLDGCRRALRTPNFWGAEIRHGQIADADLAKLPFIGASAHARMRLHGLLPLPAPIRRLGLAEHSGAGLSAFSASLHVQNSDRWSTTETADRAEDFAAVLAACRCAVRLGLWPDASPPEERGTEATGAEWEARVCVLRTVSGQSHRQDHTGRSIEADPADALRRALAVPAIQRLAGDTQARVLLEALHRNHTHDTPTVVAALGALRGAVRATS